jgi:hypothetical protein
MIMEAIFPALMFVAGGACALLGVGLYALQVMPRPRRFGFDVWTDEEARELHDRLAGIR